MLRKKKLRALVPGKWARVRVPDYECWKKANPEAWYQPKPGDEVDICIMPIYKPRYDDEKYFHWQYHAAYRSPKRGWPTYQPGDGKQWIAPHDFGLIDPAYSSPNWDRDTCHAVQEGKGPLLYEPAHDDPELCPGGDWSRYECSLCGQFVKPFLADDGELVCPMCEATGLVILDDDLLDKLEREREFASAMGLREQLEQQVHYLATYANHDGEQPTRQCVLYDDFAPHSFCFSHFMPARYSKDNQRHFWFNGGLIFQGPSCPADGSFPSLTVSLASGTGWFCHT